MDRGANRRRRGVVGELTELRLAESGMSDELERGDVSMN
jgi:hypothetical protein